jgi:hypothetical protein
VLNILADDLPMRRTPSRPHYPDGTPRPPSAWLGIAAFLTGQREPPPGAEARPASPAAPPATPHLATLKAVSGRACCLSPQPRRLSWRYPLVEIVLGWRSAR